MKNILLLLLLCTELAFSSNLSAKSRTTWSLKTSIQRALDVSPEMKKAAAEISKQKGKLIQAGAWPNPSINLQVDNEIGLDDETGGYDATEFSISQQIPLSRLRHQRKQAKAMLASAQAQYRHQQLLLEYKVANHLHILQLAKAKLKLAKKRLRLATDYQNRGRKSGRPDPLIRYLTQLETMRLNIVLQSAKQNIEAAEGEHYQAAISFKALLGIPADHPITLHPLKAVPTPTKFASFEKMLQQHPALDADKQALASSRAGVAVAKSQRFNDPTITLSRGEGFYANRRQQSTAIQLNIQVPLWNRNKGGVTQARHTVIQAQADLQLRQRNLTTNLYTSYLHLGHLIKQAKNYSSKLLKPTLRVFTLTHKSFNAGESNILTLIDANNTYFNAQERYLELLQLGWLELAELRKSAGLLLVKSRSLTPFRKGNKK